jgi:hypothetical protein
MVFVNGQFIASNGFTKSLRVSTDGINWTTKTWTTTTGIGGHVAYGAGLYAMITENGVWTSTDLVTWTQRNTTANTWVGNYGSNLIHNGTAFYSVAGSKGYYSVDGITWTITNGFPAHDAGVPYRRLASDGVTTWFVAGNKVYKFTSATTYSLVYTLSTVSVLESIEYSAGRLMAVSRSSTTNRSCYSIDGGATWTDIALPGGAYGLACDGTNWISSTSTANTVNYGTN